MVNRLNASNFQGRGRGARKLPQTPKTPSTLPNQMKPQFGAIDPPQDKPKWVCILLVHFFDHRWHFLCFFCFQVYERIYTFLLYKFQPAKSAQQNKHQ